MTRSLLLLAGALTILAWSEPAQARGRRGPGGPGMHRPFGGPGGGGFGGAFFKPEFIDRLSSELGLGDEKVEKLKEMAYDANKRQIELDSKVKQERLELRRLLEDDKPSRKKVMAAAEQVGKLETELRKNALSMLLDVRAQLTAEQQAKLRKMIADRVQERRSGRAGGPWGRRHRR